MSLEVQHSFSRKGPPESGEKREVARTSGHQLAPKGKGNPKTTFSVVRVSLFPFSSLTLSQMMRRGKKRKKILWAREGREAHSLQMGV